MAQRRKEQKGRKGSSIGSLESRERKDIRQRGEACSQEPKKRGRGRKGKKSKLKKEEGRRRKWKIYAAG